MSAAASPEESAAAAVLGAAPSELRLRLVGEASVGTRSRPFPHDLQVALEDALDVVIPTPDWLEARTFDDVVDLVRRCAESGTSSLRLIQPGDPARPPLHVLYDLHGGALRFAVLAAAIGADQPCWGFDCPLVAGRAEPPASVEALAAHHVADLLAEHPGGPHHLVGYSSGAIVAAEMARQLVAAGHEVGFLGLLDFGPVHSRHIPTRLVAPHRWAQRPRSDLPIGARIADHARRAARAVGAERLDVVARALGLGRRLDLARIRWDLADRGRVRPELRHPYAWYGLIGALDPDPPVPCSAVLFRSDQTAKGNVGLNTRVDHASVAEATLGWREVLTGDVEVRSIVGFHGDLVEEPYVGAVGAAVRTAFDEWLERPDRG